MKVHFLSNSLRMNSGFGNVAKYVALGLRRLGYDVSMSGIQTLYCSDFSYGIEQMPIDTKYVDELTQFMLNLREVNPDVVFFVGQMDAYSNSYTKVFGKQIVYCPVEGRDIPDVMSNDLRDIVKRGGIVVAQCGYGSEEMKKIGVDAPYIYHGYNDAIFKKLDYNSYGYKDYDSYCYYKTSIGQNESDPKLICKQGCYDCHYNCYGNTSGTDKCPYFKEEKVRITKLLDGRWTEKEIEISKLKEMTRGKGGGKRGGSGSGEGKFIYGFVGINFGIRKRIERLLKAYAVLIGENRSIKDRTMLHMHCKPISVNGVNLIREVARLGISSNVIFSYGSSRSNAWTEEAICRLYNTFDVHVSATSSEGFGLSHLESMACGVPNIAPACSSLIELIGDDKDINKNRGLLARIESWQMVQDGSVRALVDEYDLSAKMKELYNNDKLRERLGKNGIEWAKNHTWDKKVDEWDKLLKNWK